MKTTITTTGPEGQVNESVDDRLRTHFDEQHVLHELKHYLPSQGPLKDFIHHNSLHALQHIKFYDAIFKAAKVFGYQVTLQLDEYRELYRIGRIKDEVIERIIGQHKGQAQLQHWKENLLHKEYETAVFPRIGMLRSHWKSGYKIDLDNLVHPLLFRVLSGYLDQGISTWKFPLVSSGFLDSIKWLEQNSFASFFRGRRAKEMLLWGAHDLSELLKIVVGDESYFDQYLFDQQFSHRGWSGMVCTIESTPHSLVDQRKISLRDLLIFELLLEIDALDSRFSNGWEPLCSVVRARPMNLFASVPSSEINDVFRIWQDAFEWSYYDEVLNGLHLAQKSAKDNAAGRPMEQNQPAQEKPFQAFFCIDERECSLRRHIENVDPACETLGAPGFFGVEFYFLPENGKFYDKLCPAPVTPKYLIKEFNVKSKRKHELLYSRATHGFLTGIFASTGLGFAAGLKIVLNLLRPKMSPAISNAFAHMGSGGDLTIENKSPDDRENDLQIGFTVEEMAARIEALLRGTGLVKDFAPIVYIIAHGSSSANNPHHGAHDCGACSGRPGSVNARVCAFMANHTGVRDILRERGIHIPNETQFLGALHDTAADQIEFYDVEKLNTSNRRRHLLHAHSFETALDLNAKERSRRFASINTKASLKKVRRAILKRSVSMFEPRPELGHGTNTLCIVGRRALTSRLFLDRRAFMNSYDFTTDPEGKYLTPVMRPIALVCGGINLEYYFSRVDNYKLGAGTKLPHNVVGLIGVANSSDGDLRPGLPLQMIEVHDPVRLLIIVEHYPDVVLKTIQSSPEMYEWYINEWVHLMALHPVSGEFYHFRDGTFTPYLPTAHPIECVKDIVQLIESAKEMATNNIVDATQENLPVCLVK